jgi:type II secretory pathway component PulK
VNTASDQVLLALPGMSEAAVKALNATRKTMPIESSEDLGRILQQIAPEATWLSDLLATTSHWFIVDTEITAAGLTYHGRTVLTRTPETAVVAVHMHVIGVDG